MSVRKAKKSPVKSPKNLKELQKKLDKVKGNIQISRRNTWFSEALSNLDKKEQ